MHKSQWMELLLVGTGGFVGSVLRFTVSDLVHRLLGAAFPYGTLSVNVIGCLVIGLLGGLAESRQVIGPELRLFLFLGLLGGFTTFSSFGYELFQMARDGEQAKVLASIGLHLAAGLAAVWLGYTLTSIRWST